MIADETWILTAFSVVPQNFLILRCCFSHFHLSLNVIRRIMKFSELDDTDRKILRILQEDSTLTVKELAMRVNLSTSPTFDRQKRLEREGFIQGYHAIVDAKKTDNGITVLCNMRLKRHSQMLMDDFMQAIQSIDEITECYNTSGEYDFTLKIQTRDMDTYQEFMRTKLGNIDSVGYFHSVFVMKEVKNTHGVPIK